MMMRHEVGFNNAFGLLRVEPALRLLLAATLLELGRPGDAAAALALVAEARPGDLEVGLRRADALVAADAPRGRELAARLFAEHPGHPELFGLAQGMRGMTTLNPDPGPGDQR